VPAPGQPILIAPQQVIAHRTRLGRTPARLRRVSALGR
jgi:hypothetical protein